MSDKPPENAPSTPAADPDATVADIAAGIKDAIGREEHTPPPPPPPDSSGNPTAGNPPPAITDPSQAWKLEPIANFQVDEAGNVVLKKSGRPQRRGGNLRKAKPGDRLAGGWIQPGPAPTSKIVDPAPGADSTASEQPGEAGPGVQPPVDDGRIPLGDDVGSLIAEGVGQLGQAVGGKDAAKPAKWEAEKMKAAAARLFGDVAVRPFWLLIIVAGVYLGRILLVKRITPKGTPADGTPPPGPGTNGKREDAVHQGVDAPARAQGGFFHHFRSQGAR